MKNNNSKTLKVKILAIISILFFLTSLTIYLFYGKKYKIIEIKEHKFFVRLALSPKDQVQGLSGRKNIKKWEGMLFEFKRKSKYSFWMKNMNFPLDIIWIEEGRIVYIARNISCQHSEIISPQVEADTVLEINGGISEEYNFNIGDIVILN